jgi:hypothetical protein
MGLEICEGDTEVGQQLPGGGDTGGISRHDGL